MFGRIRAQRHEGQYTCPSRTMAFRISIVTCFPLHSSFNTPTLSKLLILVYLMVISLPAHVQNRDRTGSLLDRENEKFLS
jgi:hypothetical protein